MPTVLQLLDTTWSKFHHLQFRSKDCSESWLELLAFGTLMQRLNMFDQYWTTTATEGRAAEASGAT